MKKLNFSKKTISWRSYKLCACFQKSKCLRRTKKRIKKLNSVIFAYRTTSSLTMTFHEKKTSSKKNNSRISLINLWSISFSSFLIWRKTFNWSRNEFRKCRLKKNFWNEKKNFFLKCCSIEKSHFREISSKKNSFVQKFRRF